MCRNILIDGGGLIKKKTIIILVSVAVVAIACFVVDFYIRNSESFYPEYFKVGKFVAVNNSGRYYWYDNDNQCFTGEYTEVSFKAKGIIDAEFKETRLKEQDNGVQGGLICDGKEIVEDIRYVKIGDTLINNGLDTIEYNRFVVNSHYNMETNEVEVEHSLNAYFFGLAEDYSKQLAMYEMVDGETIRVAFYGNNLEEAEANRQRASKIVTEAE